MANALRDALRVGGGMGLRLWRGAETILNHARVVSKPSGEPDTQTIRLAIRPLW